MAVFVAPLLLAWIPIGVIAAYGIVRWRETMRMRAAGIDEHHPACARCLYLIEGWPTTICPECGSDVRETGVRIGPRPFIGARLAVAVMLSLILLPVWLMLFAWLGAERRATMSETVYESSSTMAVANLTTQAHWRRFPPRDFTQTDVSFIDRRGELAGRPVLFTIQNDEQIPSESVLAEEIRAHLPASVIEQQGPANDVSAMAAALRRLIVVQRDSTRSRAGFQTQFSTRNAAVPPSPLFARASTGSWGGGSAGWVVWAVVAAAVSTMALAVPIALVSRRPHLRQILIDEQGRPG